MLHSREGCTAKVLFEHFIKVWPLIQFILELAKDRSLHLKTKVDGSLVITVYWKPTHTDRYLKFRSHNHYCQERACMCTACMTEPRKLLPDQTKRQIHSEITKQRRTFATLLWFQIWQIFCTILPMQCRQWQNSRGEMLKNCFPDHLFWETHLFWGIRVFWVFQMPDPGFSYTHFPQVLVGLSMR